MSNKMEDYTGEYTTNYIKLVSLYQNYEQDIDGEFRIALQDVLKNKLNKINEKNITTLDDVGYKPGSGGRISFSDLLSQGIISQAMQDVYDGYVKQLGKDNLKKNGIEDIDDFIDDMGDTEYVNSADKIFSQLVDFIPIVGEIKCICDAIVGEDIITKEQLSTYERIASGVVGAAGLVGYGVLINDAVDKGIIRFTKAQTIYVKSSENLSYQGVSNAVENATAKGSTKTWEEFLAENPGKSIEEASSSYIKLIDGQSPWPEGFDTAAHTTTLKSGETFQMALDEAQPVTSPGNFATFDNIPNTDYVRNNLAVKSDWKCDCSKVVTYRVKEGVEIPVIEGPVGPQIDLSVNKYLPGGGSQIQILLDRNANKMDYFEVVSIDSIN